MTFFCVKIFISSFCLVYLVTTSATDHLEIADKLINFQDVAMAKVLKYIIKDSNLNRIFFIHDCDDEEEEVLLYMFKDFRDIAGYSVWHLKE